MSYVERFLADVIFNAASANWHGAKDKDLADSF